MPDQSDCNIGKIAEDWKRFIDATEAYAAEIARRADLFGFGGGRFDEHAILRDAARQLMHYLADVARTEFAKPGVRLDINVDRYLACATIDRKPDKFDPVALWNELRSRLGEGQGIDMAYRQSVDHLSREFRLKDGVAPQYKADRSLVLSDTIYIDRTFGNRISYHSYEDINKTLTSFLAFARWAGLDARDSSFQWDFQRKVVSRELIHIAPWLSLRTYLTSFEFVLSPAASAKFLLFVATHRQAQPKSPAVIEEHGA